MKQPTQRLASTRSARLDRAFTLTELLVVIGIIGVLVSILIPVVGKMRQSGYKTETLNRIRVIQAGIDAYQLAFRSYPGPLSDDLMYQNPGPPVMPDFGARPPQQITAAENLVLGLLGSIVVDRGNLMWDPALLNQGDQGPRSLNPRAPKTYDRFVQNASGMLSQGRFRDAAGMTAFDSDIPEFVDGYSFDPLPILYLRARKGAPGVIGDASTPPMQYDIRQIWSYTSNPPGSGRGSMIGGLDRMLQHGLATIGSPGDRLQDKMNGRPVPNSALAYFKNPALSPAQPTDQMQCTARAKDTYILISAGPDRVYGTMDDITSFGGLGE